MKREVQKRLRAAVSQNKTNTEKPNSILKEIQNSIMKDLPAGY